MCLRYRLFPRPHSLSGLYRGPGSKDVCCPPKTLIDPPGAGVVGLLLHQAGGHVASRFPPRILPSFAHATHVSVTSQAGPRHLPPCPVLSLVFALSSWSLALFPGAVPVIGFHLCPSNNWAGLENESRKNAALFE